LNGTSVQFKYDANGVRIQKIQGAATTSYILGARGNTEAVVTGSTALTYNFWAGSENVGQGKRSGSTLTRFYYVKDHLGSVRVTVNASGTVDSWFDYYPYGQLMDGRTGIASADPRYKYVGNERDAETGLDHLGHRSYDARMCRLLTVDRFVEKYPSLSPYCYGASNPLRFVDYNGDSLWLAGQNGTRACYQNGELFTADGKLYKGSDHYIRAFAAAYKQINGTSAGRKVLSSLVGSDKNYTAAVVNDLKEEDQAGEFRPNEGGGGTIAMSARCIDAGDVGHETFHGFQYENHNGGRSIANEVEAYLFGAAMSGNGSFGNSSMTGGSYQIFMERLLKGWSAPTFYDAVEAFKNGSEANRNGTYNADPKELNGNQRTLIDTIYPLLTK
jgi:RHS repeat-associated protein